MKKLLKFIFVSLFLLFTSTPINLLHAETLTTQDQSVEVESNDQNAESKSSKVVNQSPTPTTTRAITGLTANTKWSTSFFIQGANEVIATKTPDDATDEVIWKAINPYTKVTFKNPNSLRTNVTIVPPPNMQELNASYVRPGFEYNFEVSSKSDSSKKASTSLNFGGLKAQLTVLNTVNQITPDEEAWKNFLDYLNTLNNPSVSYKWKTYKYYDTSFLIEQSNLDANRQGYTDIEGTINMSNPQIPTLKVNPSTVQQGNSGPQDTRVKIEFSVKPSGSLFGQSISSNLALVKVSTSRPSLTSVPDFSYKVALAKYNQIDQELQLENIFEAHENGNTSKDNYLTLRNKSDYDFEVKNKMTVFDPVSDEPALPENLRITFKNGEYPNFDDLKVGEDYQHVFCQACIDEHEVEPIDNEWIFNVLGKNAMLVIPAGRSALDIGKIYNYKAILDWIIIVTDPPPKSL